MIYDAHIHHPNHEDGGFVIGLEGEPRFDGTLTNVEALKLHNIDNKYVAFYYISKHELENKIVHSYLKYHPRREKYTPEQVIASIKLNNPKCVMIDTLNEPYWVAYDYWKIAIEFPELTFIMPHSGGYLINDFIKICHFQKNVWIDFSLTHTILGHLGDKEKGLDYINQAISYALNAPFKDRILLSSDFPFFNQDDVFKFYNKHVNMLNSNFLNLLEIIK